MRVFIVLLACALGSLASVAEAASGLAAYNPGISVVLMGHAYYDNRDGQAPQWIDQATAFPNQGETEFGDQGLSLDGSEITLASNVDPYFKVWLAATLEGGEAEVEEAWFQTLQLPYGLQLKAGRFLSRIGYHNTKHKHKWNFIDQNLAYQSLFHGEHLSGDGAQLTWLLPTHEYWLVGTEIMQGSGLNGFGQGWANDDLADTLGISDNQLGLDDQTGPNLATAFVHFAPSMGTHQALQLGLSAAYQRNQKNLFSWGGNQIAASGSAWLAGLQAVYKHFANDAYGTHGLTVTAEYFYAASDLDTGFTSLPLANPTASQHQQAAYIEAIYGFAPRWQLGIRHSATGFGNSCIEVGNHSHDLHSSSQDSIEVAWNLSEFSHLRLELSHVRLNRPVVSGGQPGTVHANQIMLGYTMIIGAHPAHQF